MEDKRIIELIKAGDELGLTVLLEKYGALIQYVIRGVLAKYPQDMEECFNDVSYKLWKGLQEFDENRCSLKNYTALIARNAAIDCIRKISREALQRDENVVVKSAEEEYFGGEKSDRQEQLLQAMQKLKKSEKELLLRKYFYLQPVSKIARELGCTERSVEGKLARIRKKLKKMMDD